MSVVGFATHLRAPRFLPMSAQGSSRSARPPPSTSAPWRRSTRTTDPTGRLRARQTSGRAGDGTGCGQPGPGSGSAQVPAATHSDLAWRRAGRVYGRRPSRYRCRPTAASVGDRSPARAGTLVGVIEAGAKQVPRPGSPVGLCCLEAREGVFADETAPRLSCAQFPMGACWPTAPPATWPSLRGPQGRPGQRRHNRSGRKWALRLLRGVTRSEQRRRLCSRTEHAQALTRTSTRRHGGTESGNGEKPPARRRRMDL